MTSMLPPVSKIKTKGAPKCHRSKKSTKRDPLYFEHVDASLRHPDKTHVLQKQKTSWRPKV